MTRKHTIAVAALTLLALVVLSGCTRVKMPETRDTVHTVDQRVPLGSAKKVAAEVRMGVGELVLDGNAHQGDALSARFEYAPATWKPVLESAVSSDGVRVQIRQPAVKAPMFAETRNTWTVGMARGVPTDLVLQLGVGTSRIDLSAIDVRDVRVISGVGEAAVDLTGPRTKDVGVDIDAGVGSLTVKLPQDVGVRVEGVADGVGKLTADGLTKQGEDYVNEAWSRPGPKMTVRVTRGVGDLKLVAHQ